MRAIQKHVGRNVVAEELSLEERVADLEKQVTLLSKEVFKKRSKPGWVRKIVGSMENDKVRLIEEELKRLMFDVKDV